MKRWEEQASINAPADKVYDYVSDFARHPEWALHDLEVSKVGDGPVGVGTRFQTVAKQFGTQREQSTITEMKPGASFAWDSAGALGIAHHWFTVQEQQGTTTLRKGMELTQPKLLAKMMSLKLNGDVPKGLRADLQKIKSNLEGSAG